MANRIEFLINELKVALVEKIYAKYPAGVIAHYKSCWIVYPAPTDNETILGSGKIEIEAILDAYYKLYPEQVVYG